MKKFILNLIIYILPFLIGILFFFISLIAVSNYLSENSDLYQLDERIEYLFIGDSHISLGVNDSLIPSSKNISSLAEPYYFTYQKLKYFLNDTKVKTVILSYNYGDLTIDNDKFTIGSNSTFFADNYFFILNTTEKIRIIYWNRQKLFELIKRTYHAFYCHYKNIDQKNNHLYDGYMTKSSKKRPNSKTITKRIKILFYRNNRLKKYSKQNIKYLFKIIELCQKKDIELFLLTTPLSKLFHNHIPINYKNKFNEILSKSKVSHINLAKYIDNNSLFSYDGDHLNKNGAEVLSIKLMKELKINR